MNEGQEAKPIALRAVVKNKLSERTGVLDRYEDDGTSAVLTGGGGQGEYTAPAHYLIDLSARRQEP